MLFTYTYTYGSVTIISQSFDTWFGEYFEEILAFEKKVGLNITRYFTVIFQGHLHNGERRSNTV